MITPQETLIERLHHCSHCEHRKSTGFMARCNQCGCFIEAKTRLANQSCPVGKWVAVGGEKPVQESKIIKSHCCGSK